MNPHNLRFQPRGGLQNLPGGGWPSDSRFVYPNNPLTPADDALLAKQNAAFAELQAFIPTVLVYDKDGNLDIGKTDKKQTALVGIQIVLLDADIAAAGATPDFWLPGRVDYVATLAAVKTAAVD